MMEVKVEIGQDYDARPLTTTEEVPPEELEGVPVRTKMPTLDDVLSPEELETLTAEGLAANPELTEEEQAAATAQAQQIEANMNYLKQQRFYQFMNHRPQPATLRKVDWGLLRFLMIIAEKAEFEEDETIKALTDEQWYHGIITGNVRVFKVIQGDGSHKVQVSLRQKYHRLSTQLMAPEGWTPPQTRAQKRSSKK